MSYKYQIKLTPIDAYFFGGEKHTKNNAGIYEMDYFVKSELYPQQSSLLGLLRFYLLKSKTLLSPQENNKVKEANTAIGIQSFDYNFKDKKTGATEQTFGIITTISALYFIKEEQNYIIAPLDFNFELKKEYDNYILENYDVKKSNNPFLINIKDNLTVNFFKNQEQENDTNFFFIKQNMVGNKKGKDGITEDDGFYKQTRYKLNKNCSFAFDVELTEELKEDTQLIPFGAEQQLFKIEIKNINATTKLNLNITKNKPAIFCISDSFIPKIDWQDILFSVNEKITFRNLQSNTSTTNYSSLSKGYKISHRYNLLKRGSVLYFNDIEQLNKTADLFNNKNAQNIGFNQIQIIQKQ